VCGEEIVGENGSLRRKRVETPKSTINQATNAANGKDLEDIWEKASRMARLEIETSRLLGDYYGPDMSMGSASSEDRPPRPPSRPPDSTPTLPPNPGPSPSGPPVECLMGRTREEYIFDTLVAITPADILTDPSTPQGMAFDYMVNDDPALEDPCSINTIEQRYGLQVLYFSTGGDEWDENSGWLGEDQECLWYGVECPDGSDHITLIVLRKYSSLF
jgi:hypothetical protein